MIKSEELFYLTAIIWMPIGIVGRSVILIGLALVAVGIALFLTYFRRNRDCIYNEIRLSNRGEDDTIEIQTQSYRGNHSDKE